ACESGFSGYFKAFLLSGFHCDSPLGKTQPEAYNRGCLGHIASAVWLNVPVGVCAPIGTANLEAGAGIEPAYCTFQESCLSHLAIPPLKNSQRTLKNFLLSSIERVGTNLGSAIVQVHLQFLCKIIARLFPAIDRFSTWFSDSLINLASLSQAAQNRVHRSKD